MATQRFNTLINGIPTNVQATTVSTGSASGGQILALTSSGLLDQSVMPAGIAPTAITATPTTAISAGQLVNFYSNAGALAVRPADSTTTGSEANAYAPSAVASGVAGSFQVSGVISGLSGLTIGTLFLGTVGAPTSTAPSTSGSIVQQVGKALSATSMEFMPTNPIVIQ